MFYNCYDKYGRYLGHTQTQSAANELIQLGNMRATSEAHSAWLKAKATRPNLSFSEFEVEYRSYIQEVKKQNEKSSAKWAIIILIITLLIFILAGGN